MLRPPPEEDQEDEALQQSHESDEDEENVPELVDSKALNLDDLEVCVKKI